MESISGLTPTVSRRTLLSGGIAAGVAGVQTASICAQEGHSPMTEPTPVDKMQRVLRALELFGEQVPDARDAPAASKGEIAEAERLLGRQLPETMRLLYEAHNGSQRIVTCWPLTSESDEALSVVTGSELYRRWHWDVPRELFLFGDSGSESAFGL
jgi:hypothetical protein